MAQPGAVLAGKQTHPGGRQEWASSPQKDSHLEPPILCPAEGPRRAQQVLSKSSHHRQEAQHQVTDAKAPGSHSPAPD